MIEIYGLSKSYSNTSVKAVDDLTLDKISGEIFGFLGPNGAGKSTTIKCLTGIIPFEEGNIKVCGYDIKDNPIEAKKCIGFVPDEHIVYEKLTGMEYLKFIADVFSVESARREELVALYLEKFEMKDKIDRLISSYSHGMKQKLSIIAALIHEPKVWILDEPLTGLDPKSAFILKEIMREEAEKGNTVFFSSHVLDVAEKICDRVGIINKGKLIAVCTIKELKERRSDMSLEDFFLSVTQKEGIL